MRRNALIDILLVIALILVVLAADVLAFSGLSVIHPGQPLFFLQRSSEQIRTAITSSTTARLDYLLTRLETRIDDVNGSAGTIKEANSAAELNYVIDQAALTAAKLTGATDQAQLIKLRPEPAICPPGTGWIVHPAHRAANCLYPIGSKSGWIYHAA